MKDTKRYKPGNRKIARLMNDYLKKVGFDFNKLPKAFKDYVTHDKK